MKTLLFLSLILLSSNLSGQFEADKLSGVKIGESARYSENDTIPIVINLTASKEKNTALYYLNGKQINEQIAHTLNPNNIEAINVEKEQDKRDKSKTIGKIYIKTKENYNPKWISLNGLKEKYLDLQVETATLFMIDEKAINSDYDEYKVDEKNILKIEVQSVIDDKEKLDINIIRLITRTTENVKKANTIRLKGNEH